MEPHNSQGLPAATWTAAERRPEQPEQPQQASSMQAMTAADSLSQVSI